MRFVFVSYNYSADIHTPQEWLDRVKIYVGSLECLSKNHTVMRVEQINYTGNFFAQWGSVLLRGLWQKDKLFSAKIKWLCKKPPAGCSYRKRFVFPATGDTITLVIRRRRVKIIAQNHAEKPFTGIKKYLQRIADKYIDAYFFASHAAGAEWVSKGNLSSEKKIHEIMEVSSVFYPVDKIFARSKTQVSGNPVFLWAGRLNVNKDPLTVLKAFFKFLQFQPAARLYMAYQTVELLPQVKLLINTEKSNGNAVVLIGDLPHPEMQYWFNSADFIISGSHYEGSSTAICEAMSCGCVPVVTDIPSFRAMTANGECGLLYKAGDENALLSALLQAMEINIKVKQNKTLEHFKNKLSFEAIAGKIQEVVASM